MASSKRLEGYKCSILGIQEEKIKRRRMLRQDRPFREVYKGVQVTLGCGGCRCRQMWTVNR